MSKQADNKHDEHVCECACACKWNPVKHSTNPSVQFSRPYDNVLRGQGMKAKRETVGEGRKYEHLK